MAKPKEMKPRKDKAEARITEREAERGIYIDFEGFEDRTPSILGILIGEKLEQLVLDEKLALGAAAKGLRVSTLAECINSLMAVSKEEDRLIVAYSQHEKNVIREFAQIEMEGRYRDARMIAKRWMAKCRTDQPLSGRGLKDFLDFIGYPRGTHLGEKKTTSRLKAVAEMLERRGKLDTLTPVVKAKWTKLLEHNGIDCRGMRALVLLAAKELNCESHAATK